MAVVSQETQAELLVKQLQKLSPEKKVLWLQGWDCLPYDHISPSSDVMAKRIDALTSLLEEEVPFCLALSAQSLIQYVPPPVSLLGETLSLRVESKIARDKLIDFLQNKGFQRSTTVYEVGEFAIRGGIVDIFPASFSNPLRIDFFGEEIEKIRIFDPMSQKTIGELNGFSIKPITEILLTKKGIDIFQDKYNEVFKNSLQDPLYKAISDGRNYAGQEHYLPLFYQTVAKITDYVPAYCSVIFDHNVTQAVKEHISLINNYYQARLDPVFNNSNSYPPLHPQYLYWRDNEYQDFIKGFQIIDFMEWSEHCEELPDLSFARKQGELFIKLKEIVNTNSKQIIIVSQSEGTRQRIEQLLKDNEISRILPVSTFPPPNASKDYIYSLVFPLNHGFITKDQIVVSDFDILGEKTNKKNISKQKTEQFFQEASQLCDGDYVVHRDHGIGKYKGLETLKVDKILHDCLCLLYEDGDKLYLPVENLELLSRYGSNQVTIQLDKLGAAAWQNRKARVKKRLKDVADYLIKIAAQRSLEYGEVLAALPESFDKFCSQFPYPETEDQIRTIEEVIQDLASGKPMDRLVCGDVGFGKTEVALRAAFIAVASGKQVAILVPTTLLCRQHFQNFSQRFKGFSYKVAQLSRMIRDKEVRLIKQALEDGSIDIIIGTHALFSDNTKFNNLGLVIVDEEQHFGVKQKEKLKKICKNVHILTLTATPIPRTLQLALSGVRELSLITAPPIDRLSVRTFVSPYDLVSLREAMLRESHRGGQIFFVTPRIEYLPKILDQLQEVVPNLKIGVAHGQMPAKDLEQVMTSFYDSNFDILLATNIIESGIDVPTANTLIIHRADLFGLSQLYQLRGRVGRSRAQAYAYLTIPDSEALSVAAKKRLEVMQHLDHLGAGFSLASYDMDIRGAGNIVGEEQSGHIREVGVELYQQLLHEAINQVKSQGQDIEIVNDDWSPQIQIGVSILIPESYVSDLSLRLNLYQRIAKLKNHDEIDDFTAELIDRFGSLPVEIKNLLQVMRLKQICHQAGISRLEAGSRGVMIAFFQDQFTSPDKLIYFLQSKSAQKLGESKLRPDQKLIFFYPLKVNSILDYCLEIVKSLAELL